MYRTHVFDVVISQGCTNAEPRVAVVIKLLAVAPHICGTPYGTSFMCHLGALNFETFSRFLENLSIPLVSCDFIALVALSLGLGALM